MWGCFASGGARSCAGCLGCPRSVWISMPRKSDVYASNIAFLCLDYQISMPWISDLYASNIESLCLDYRISMPWISDLYALNVGCLCLEYRICILEYRIHMHVCRAVWGCLQSVCALIVPPPIIMECRVCVWKYAFDILLNTFVCIFEPGCRAAGGCPPRGLGGEGGGGGSPKWLPL